MSDVPARMQEVFRDVFEDDDLTLFDAMTAADVEDWDSLQHINLIIAIEKEFNIKFATAEIARLKQDGENVGTFTQLIERKVSGDAAAGSA